jgi:hypothetical protein
MSGSNPRPVWKREAFHVVEALFAIVLIAPAVLVVWAVLGWWSWGTLHQGGEG